MQSTLELAVIFDEWQAGLPPAEAGWCRRALENAAGCALLGQDEARELLVVLLLYCAGRLPRQV